MTNQELFTKVTGLTWNVNLLNNMSEEKLLWLIPDGAMLSRSGRKQEFTKQLLEELSINIESKISTEELIKDKTSEESTIIAVWDYIWNEETWNTSYTKDNSALAAYYENNPDEDLWNETENRAANFNDKRYTIEIYGNAEMTSDFTEKQFDALWVSDTIQKLTNSEDNTEVYYTDMFYSLDENAHELFLNSEMTETANKFAKFNSFNFTNCTHCWGGAINAPGASYPWCVVNLDKPTTGVIKLEYDGGEVVYPWGNKNKEFTKGYAICSIPNEFGEEYKLDANGDTTFDASKLVVTIIK